MNCNKSYVNVVYLSPSLQVSYCTVLILFLVVT